MERALVIGSSGGIGAALVAALRAQGSEVVGLSRRDDGLDVTDEGSVVRCFAGLSGAFDRVIVATGALETDGYVPEKAVAQVSQAGLVSQFLLNAAGPMIVLREAVRFLPKERRSVVAVLSARVGSIGDNRIGGWHGYRAAKAAVNQFVHGAAIELARTHKRACVVSLHPGTVATPFTAKYAGRHKTVPAGEAAENLLAVMDQMTPAQTGGFFDWAGEVVPW